MTITIVYDSIFGNTAQIAKAIASELEASHIVRLVQVTDAKALDLSDSELLIVGSPTRGFRPTPAIAEFVEGLGSQTTGKRAVSFDTRIGLEDIHPAPLRWVVDAGGYAAQRIEAVLERKGFVAAGTPQGFVVAGTEGPLKPGEVERAHQWARSLVGQMQAA
jgi:flavodoxin